MDKRSQGPLGRAIDLLGLGRLATHLAVSGQAVRKWGASGRLPRTEWTGETSYAETIERLTEGAVSKTELLSKWPADEPPEPPSLPVVAPAINPVSGPAIERRGVAPPEQHHGLSPFAMGVDRREHGDAELAVEGAR